MGLKCSALSFFALFYVAFWFSDRFSYALMQMRYIALR